MKRKRKAALLLVAALFVSLSLPVLAASGSATVYITRTGSKYHTSTCSYLSQSKIAVSLQEAVNGGYTRCSRCKPPSLDSSTASYHTPPPVAKSGSGSSSSSNSKSSDVNISTVAVVAAASGFGGYLVGRRRKDPS